MSVIDWLFLAKLGCVLLFAAAVLHSLTRCFEMWLDGVPTLEERDRDTDLDIDVEETTVVSAVQTPPAAEDDVDHAVCAGCGHGGALDDEGRCWRCGAKNQGAA